MDFEGVSPIGRNIARYRKLAGLSASELADRVGEGLTRSVIANLENGRKDDITVKQLFALAAVLEVPPAYLVVDTYRPRETAPFPMPRSTITTFDFKTLTEEPIAPRNSEAFKWFGGREIYVSRAGSPAPAPSEVFGVQNAMNAYDAAARRFSVRTRRLIELREDTRPRDESMPSREDEQTDAELQLVEAAEDVIWTSRLVRERGVELPVSTEDVLGVLERLGIRGPAIDELRGDG